CGRGLTRWTATGRALGSRVPLFFTALPDFAVKDRRSPAVPYPVGRAVSGLAREGRPSLAGPASPARAEAHQPRLPKLIRDTPAGPARNDVRRAGASSPQVVAA